MGKMTYLWVTMLTTELLETRIIKIDVYGNPVWYRYKEK